MDFPISPYAATKKAGELLCHTYHHLYGMGVTCLRFFTVYGARQRPDLAIYKFTERMERGEAVEIFGDGSMRRDFTYVADTVEGIVRAMKKCEGYRIYNHLGAGRPVTVSETVEGLEHVRWGSVRSGSISRRLQGMCGRRGRILDGRGRNWGMSQKQILRAG